MKEKAHFICCDKINLYPARMYQWDPRRLRSRVKLQIDSHRLLIRKNTMLFMIGSSTEIA